MHTHAETDLVRTGANLTEVELISTLDSSGIDASICLPLPKPLDQVAAQDAIALAAVFKIES